MAYDLNNPNKYRKVGGFHDNEPHRVEVSRDGRVYRVVHHDGTSSEWAETKNTPYDQTLIDGRVARGEWEQLPDDAVGDKEATA
jgi:hypothetical protein